MIDDLVPITLFLVIGAAYWGYLYYQNRSRAEIQKTIRLTIEKGGEIDPDIFERLLNPEPTATRDLRRTAIWLSLAGGLVLCGIAIPDALRGCLAAAAFPFAIGMAYLFMWKYGLRNEPS